MLDDPEVGEVCFQYSIRDADRIKVRRPFDPSLFAFNTLLEMQAPQPPSGEAPPQASFNTLLEMPDWFPTER